MRFWVLICTAAALGSATPAAAQISIVGMRDLAFGAVIVGIPTSVPPSDPLRSGQFRITAPAGSRVRLDFALPTQLVGQGNARMPISFSKTDALAVGNAPGSVPVVLSPNLNANLKYEMGSSTAVNIFLGGTVSPASNQAPGSYVGTVTLTVNIQ